MKVVQIKPVCGYASEYDRLQVFTRHRQSTTIGGMGDIFNGLYFEALQNSRTGFI
jgi:hypothetical protein